MKTILNKIQHSLATELIVVFKKELLLIFAVSVLISVLTLVPTLYMLQLYDRIMLSQNLESLVIISLTILVLYLMYGYAEFLRSKLMIVIGNRIERRYIQGLFDASVKRFLSDKRAEPSDILRSFVEFKQFIAGPAISYFFDLLLSPIYILVAFMLHKLLGIACMLTIFVQCMLLVANHRRNQRDAAGKPQSYAQLKRYVHGNLRNMLPLHVMGMTGYFKNKVLVLHESSVLENAHKRDIEQVFAKITRYFRYLTQIISLAVGAYLAIHGEISVGSMIAANIIFSRALAAYDHVLQIWQQFLTFLDNNQKLTTAMSVSEPASHTSLTSCFHGQLQQLTFSDFSAAYAAQVAPVVSHVNIDMQAGEVIAIVGASGSGKTTLCKSILGLLPHVQGQLAYNGTAVALTQLQNINQIAGYLPQDFQLFEGTIAENICRFGELDSQLITAAAIDAGIHEWVLRLPNGYDTMIGPAGTGLSGGQKQLLGLARAIYGQTTLVILDEPNSNLDESGDRSLIQVLLKLKQKGVITLVITHKENLLRFVDKVLWLDAGQPSAFGNSKEVLDAMKAVGRVS